MKQTETKKSGANTNKYQLFADIIKNTLQYENSAVAISFSKIPPVGVEQLKEKIRLCQMLDRVRFNREIFYTEVINHRCDGGSSSCGMKETSERIKNGEFLSKMGLFGSKRAARRFSNSNSRIEFGTVKIVSFAPLENLIFEPDVIVIICNAKQGMKITEAYSYETGKRPLGMTGPPICSSIVAAPYLTGEVTYSFGDHGARKYMNIKDEEVFVGIPAELLQDISENLDKMKSLK
jgi:uncharacterized protein (DUF169 family)